MARDFKRTDRLGDAIQRFLAQLLQFEVRDPRIGMVNINEVSVSRDLSVARVYMTFVGKESDEECAKAEEALNNAAGFLRSQLAKELDIRTTPRLSFIYDTTSVRGQKLSNLIDQAVQQDRSASDERGDDGATD